MSCDGYDQIQYEANIAMKLREAEIEATSTQKRFTHAEVMASLHDRLRNEEKI